MKVYPPEFKADAVALYLSDPTRTYASVAKDLGVNHETLRLLTAGALELAQAAGVFNAGTRGWRTAQRRVATEALTRPQPELSGTTWLEKIHTERISTWAGDRSATRVALIDPILERLHATPGVPDDAATVLEPARWLLSEAAEGITLTQIGNLPKPLVVAMNDTYNYYDLPGYRPRGEHDVSALTELRELLHRAGLTRRTGRRLILSARGHQVRDDIAALWNAVTAQLVTGDDIQGTAAELTLLVLAPGRPIDRDRLERILIDALTEDGWRDQRTQNFPDAGDIAYACAPLRHRLQALRLLGTEKTWNAPYQLTPTGQVAALTALHARALRPRTTIGT